MGLVAILTVVTKGLLISPRFTPYEFLSHVSSALLQIVNQWLNFTYSRTNAFRYGRQNKNPADKNRTHNFRTSRCAGHLLDHSGDEGCKDKTSSWHLIRFPDGSKIGPTL